MRTFKNLAVLTTAVIALLSWGCDVFNEKEPMKAPTITIGEPLFDTEAMTMTLLFTPSQNTTAWHYKIEREGATADFTFVAGEQPKEIVVDIEFDVVYTVSAYAEGQGLEGDLVIKDFCLLTVPTITVSKPLFDESTMTLSFNVTPSEGAHHWYWGVKDSEYTRYEGDEAQTVNCTVEYDVNYTFLFRAENEQSQGETKEIEFTVIKPVADIAIENLTAYTLDAVITKKEHCVKYVAGAMHTSAYDRNIFIEQAQTSLNPDPTYPFAVFNSATESRTFSEQDLVRNSLLSSEENAGIILLPNTSYTIAVYGEDANGNYTVTTKEVVIPEVELNGTSAISIEVSDITLTSANATITAETGVKILTGYIDPALAKADTEKPFDFEGKSDAEIKNYIASVVKGVPMIYSNTFTYLLSDGFANETEYVAYALAIKDGKVGDVVFTTFKTLRPSLSGVANIVDAEIEPQTTHETLTVKLTVDDAATKVRLYAAPASDHAAYAENLVFIMDSDNYQNYREEYEVVDGVATAVVSIYHPGANYYLYASAVDTNGRAGAIACVSQLAGLDTEYYTTIEEIVDEGGMDYTGTGSATLSVEVIEVVDERVSAILTASNYSENVDTVWFIRYNGLISDVETQVKEAFAEYLEEETIIGSYKIAKQGIGIKYEDGGSDWNPKYDALQSYSSAWGGDVIVVVILDADGKLRIDSYCYYDEASAKIVIVEL
ncbi:MAG: hypothetical protein J6U73_08055 [Alistipes sp.]|nr:hypothetical protein [Alistipes sp.]